MKIDFIINSLTGGGAERVMTTLANGFSETSKEIKLITFNESEAYELNNLVKRIKLHEGRFKNHILRSTLNLFKFYFKKKNRPDLIVSFMPDTNLISICVAKIFRIKIIISEHNNHLANPSNKSKWIRKYFYRYANATTVLTNFDVNYFESMGAKVTVLPNPILLPKAITKYNLRNKNILVAGSLKRYDVKGFDSLLYLIEPVLKSNLDWTLTIAGSGESGTTVLKKITHKLKLEKQVIFTGFCKNIQELMQNSQIYVLASKYEGLPMVLMEALSNGMACISYDCVSGPRDLIEDKKNGLLIDNQNKEAMQDGIRQLINNYNLRETLAQQAPQSVTKYSLENILTQWELLIESIVKNGK